MKFLTLKVRQKISFEAFLKNYTVSELFLDQILSSYHQLINFGLLRAQIATEKVQECYEEIITGELNACFKVLIQLNLEQA